jgi:hypothetical protein
MTPITYALRTIPEELKAGVTAVRKDFPDRFRASRSAVALHFEADSALGPDAVAVRGDASSGVTVRYGSRSTAFRALGRLLAAESDADLTFEERSPFSMRGLMVDASRNGVLTPEAAETFLRRCALMGVNMLMLYTEDTYEVPGEPFFGYLRGAYSHDERQRLDEAAHVLGIELIPCIQTLAHLAQMLQWDPNFKYRDTPNILLSGDDDTYALIRKLIEAAQAPVRSRRIHVGMDEAHGLGTGRYRERFGDQPPFDIMNRHLARVRDICREYGLRPMIWSDMYFQLGSKTHDYYDMGWTIPEAVAKGIPPEVELVYWDYYHADVETYRKMIGFHRQLGREPLMAGGIWTWSHLWCALPWSFTAIQACMEACRQEHLREVFMTMWGDDGMEVDLFSALPGVQYFCEQAFGAPDPMAAARRHFRGSCGVAFDPWVEAAGVDSNPAIREPAMSHTALGRALLWQDPALAIVDPVIGETDLRDWYGRLARKLSADSRPGGLAERLAFPAAIAAVLEVKAHLRRDLSRALARRDRRTLKRLLETDVAAALRRVETLWKCHRTMWMNTYKPFGWEVLECRYGGLLARLRTLQSRLQAFLAGDVRSLPELEAKLLNPWEGRTADHLHFSYSRVKTPSCIK